MPSPNNSTIAYLPGPVPADPKQIPRYLREEFEKIGSAIKALADGHVEMTHVAPPKPRDGDKRLSDGVNWNPTGAGVPRPVIYHSGDWQEYV
jgi:hypothetical protein